MTSAELLGRTNSQKEAAKFVYDMWPLAVCAPYQEDDRKSKYFAKKANRPVVLLVWASHATMKDGNDPCAIVEEKLEGWNQELWMKNLKEAGEIKTSVLERLFGKIFSKGGSKDARPSETNRNP